VFLGANLEPFLLVLVAKTGSGIFSGVRHGGFPPCACLAAFDPHAGRAGKRECAYALFAVGGE
jgi:hypothetical protein